MTLHVYGPARDAEGKPSYRALLRSTFRDFADGIRRRELWLFLGWRDVRRHYKRSILGPFWLTLSMGITVGGLGILYAKIFNREIDTYIPFLAIGFIMWGLIGGSIGGACDVFSGAAGSIRQVRMPLSLYLFQNAWKQFITFLHNFVIYILVAAIFGIWPGAAGLLFIPAVFLIVVNGLFISMILGPLCARYRDIPMIVASIMQFAFFLSPILWDPEHVQNRALFLGLNPFYHFIEIVREPLLGRTASLVNWLACIGITIVLGVLALSFFSRYRARITYWA